MKELRIDDYTITTLECLFKERTGKDYDEVLDASVKMYLYVLNQRIYPAAVVQGFYSAMAVIYNLSAGQFVQMQNFYKQQIN